MLEIYFMGTHCTHWRKGPETCVCSLVHPSLWGKKYIRIWKKNVLDTVGGFLSGSLCTKARRDISENWKTRVPAVSLWPCGPVALLPCGPSFRWWNLQSLFFTPAALLWRNGEPPLVAGMKQGSFPCSKVCHTTRVCRFVDSQSSFNHTNVSWTMWPCP